MPLTRIDSAFLDLDAIGGIDFDVQSGIPTLKVDATNHRVGIGTDNPTSKLEVSGGDLYVNSLDGNEVDIKLGIHATHSNFGVIKNVRSSDSQNFLSFNIHNGSLYEVLQIHYDEGLYVRGNGNYNTSAYTGNVSHVLFGDQEEQFADIVVESESASSRLGSFIFKTKGTVGELPQERLRITSGGNVGIGTNSPKEHLHVEGEIVQSSNKALMGNLYFDSGWKYIGNGAGGAVKWNASYMEFITAAVNSSGADVSANPSTKMVIEPGGNVGIGTNNPNQKLHVLGSALISSDTTTTSSQYATLTIGERPAGDAYASIEFKYDGNNISSKIDGRDKELAVWANWNSAAGERLKILGTSASEDVILRPGTVAVIQASHNTSTGASATYFAGIAHFQRTNTAFEGADIRLSRAVDNAYHYSVDVYGDSTTNPRLRFVNVPASREDFHLDHTGNIGIGTNSAATKVVVYNGVVKLQGTSGGEDSRVEFSRVGGRNSWIGIPEWNDDALMIYAPGVSSGNYLAGACEQGVWSFAGHNGTSSTEGLRIDQAGNVGIGTNSPDQKLHVNGNIKSNRYLGPDTATSNVWLSVGTNTQNPSVALWARDHANYPGQTHILGRTTNASNIAGQIRFYTYNGSAWSIRGMWGKNGSLGIRNSANDPLAKLHVESAATTAGWQIRTDSVGLSNESGFYRDASDHYEMVLRNGLGGLSYIKNDGGASTANLRFNVQGNENLTILSDGNVGIGTINPSSKLDVHGTGTVARFGDLDNVDQLNIRIASGYPTLYCPSSADSLQLASLGSVQVAINSNNNTTESFRIVANGMDSGGSELFKIDTSGNFKISQALPGWTNSTNHPILMWDYKLGPGDMMYMASGGNTAIADQMALVISDGHGFKVGKSGWDGITDSDISSTNEFFRVTPSGNVGIGTNSPAYKFEVYNDVNAGTQGVFANLSTGASAYSGIRIQGSAGSAYLWMNSAGRSTDGGVKNVTLRNDVGALHLQAKGGGHTNTHAGLHVQTDTNNIGIGTDDPSYQLHVEESAYFRRGIHVAPLASNELQTRSPINSGFYQVNNPETTDGWPIDPSWMHLLANTHNNTSNYYSQQFASSFFDQELYFRNTNASGTTTSQSWGQVMHTGSTLKPVYAESSGSTDDYSRYWYPGGEYYVSVHGITAPGDLNDMLEQGYYHVANTATNNPNSSYGYLKVQRHQGSQYSLQHFITSGDTSRQWMRSSYPFLGDPSGRAWDSWYSYGALERENQFTNRQNIIGPTSTSTFTGLNSNTSSNRAQFVLHSSYSDVVISSSATNANGHGSTITFAASNPANAADYNKFVINKGNWSARTQFLDFAYENTEHPNPHSVINNGDSVMTLDGQLKRVGIGNFSEARTPSYPLDVNFNGDSGARIKGHTSHASLYIDAASGYAGYIRFRQGGSDKFWVTNDGSNNLNFRPNGGSNSVQFLNNGECIFNNNVGIGTNNPNYKLHVNGMAVFTAPAPSATNSDDHQLSPISIVERLPGGSQTGANDESPNLNFHWNGRVSNSLWMGANGQLNYGSYSTSGQPASPADGDFACRELNLGGNAGRMLIGPSTTHSRYLRIGVVPGSSTTTADISVTNGNLHVDAAVGNYGVYLNWYGGTNGVYVGDGSAGQIFRIDGNGTTTASGSKNFQIPHPLPSKNDTHQLFHCSIESPQADNNYNGMVTLVDGKAEINIDTEFGMTEGTFGALNKNIRRMVTNESGWTAVKSSITGNVLTIEAQDPTCTDECFWMVIGQRKDQVMINSRLTDDQGNLILERINSEVLDSPE